MSQEWYYAKGERRHGPISSKQLRGLAESGELQPNDLVWTEGMTDWRPAHAVKGLMVTSPTPPPLHGPPPIMPPTQSDTVSAGDGHASGDSTPRQPWYSHWAFLGLAMVVFFPITLVLVWKKGTYSKRAKWAWTAACLAWFVFIMASNDPNNPDGGSSTNAARSSGQKTEFTSGPDANETLRGMTDEQVLQLLGKPDLSTGSKGGSISTRLLPPHQHSPDSVFDEDWYYKKRIKNPRTGKTDTLHVYLYEGKVIACSGP